MTIAGSPGATLPRVDAATMQALTSTLQSLVQVLQQLVTVLSAPGAVAGAGAGTAQLGGPPSTAAGGAGCGAMDAVSGGCGASTAALGGGASTTGGAAGAPDQPDDSDQQPSPAPAPGPAGGGAHQGPDGGHASRSHDDAGAATGPSNFDTDLPRKNPRTVAEAIAWAKQQVDHPSQNWDHLCLGFVARAFGWSGGSGEPMASTQWAHTPASMKHAGDRNAPVGSLVFWSTGHEAGHVAMVVAPGMVASNDIRRPGKIDIVPMSEIDKSWGAHYLGWTPPYFPKAAK